MHFPGLGRAVSHRAPHADTIERQGVREPHMQTSTATCISAILRQILAQSGWLRSELRRQQQAGLGHRRMRELCDQLDALDSSVQWDLRDELQRVSGRTSGSAARILEWLRSDLDPLLRLVGRLDVECSSPAMVAAAMTACSEIIRCSRDIECALAPIAQAPRAARDRNRTWRRAMPAAEAPQLC